MADPVRHLTDEEIDPKTLPHHLHHEWRPHDSRHAFLRSVIGTREVKIPREDLERCGRMWEIPSMERDQKKAKDEGDYLKKMSLWRRIRAYWAGYWLSLPTLLVISERTWRLIMSLCHTHADLEILNDDTVAITANIPAMRFWQYKAG
ncbi:hypothetical protein K504DRAFT_508464 [Pleomassaria siparia CBS 279.74]|uniref:Uncharacterized protein n=1 Tax=Pleomassaria siparia CBS 279.74 TaxID=1314801 RepID=A0A6G1JS63_9PLEO|nr:hypothetical protein K504DRAFT_508464 [Pleomassaria siparia CBS 279.74]